MRGGSWIIKGPMKGLSIQKTHNWKSVRVHACDHEVQDNWKIDEEFEFLVVVAVEERCGSNPYYFQNPSQVEFVVLYAIIFHSLLHLCNWIKFYNCNQAFPLN